jgi:hypothetical protein
LFLDRTRCSFTMTRFTGLSFSWRHWTNFFFYFYRVNNSTCRRYRKRTADSIVESGNELEDPDKKESKHKKRKKSKKSKKKKKQHEKSESKNESTEKTFQVLLKDSV